MIEAASPTRQVSALRSPVLIITGEFDSTVPVEQGREMRDALQRAGRSFRYVEYPRVGHTWDSWGMDERVEMLTEMERFLSEHLGTSPR
jgi:dipeptidyl aminopeptidase/acylaminoacyl peptidase